MHSLDATVDASLYASLYASIYASLYAADTSLYTATADTTHLFTREFCVLLNSEKTTTRLASKI